jgi:uncharacterized protein (DUF58 family)
MGDRPIEWEAAGWVAPVVVAFCLLAPVVVVFGHDNLVVFAGPLVGALAGGWWSAAPGRDVRIEPTLSARRVFESEEATLAAVIHLPRRTRLRDITLHAGDHVVSELLEYEASQGSVVRLKWRLEAVRWGRVDPRVTLVLRGSVGLRRGTVELSLPSLSIFPHARRLARTPRPFELHDRLGLHLSRRKGEGVEFGGLREYVVGDSLRHVNWPASARLGRLHVTERLVEQAAKVVVIVDATRDIRQSNSSTLQLAVQGTLAVVSSALRKGDRTGVVGLGGSVRWLAPDLGQRHYYRVLEAVMEASAGGTAPKNVSSLPRAVLPHDALLIAFSPLIDERVVEVLTQLRIQGRDLIIVDTLQVEPTPANENESLAVLMWRLHRQRIHQKLVEVGIPLLTWREGVELAEVLSPVNARPPTSAGRR